METFLKTGFAQISLSAQKIRVAQNLGGAAAPPAPPARTPMIKVIFCIYDFKQKWEWKLASLRTCPFQWALTDNHQ